MSGIEHRTTEELVAGLDEVRSSPTDEGTVDLIVRRPGVDAREVLSEGELDITDGLVGDNWNQKPTSMGAPHPDMQLTLINSRLLALVCPDPDRRPLAGDQLVVDLSLAPDDLPVWSRLRIGEAVIEVTDQPHTGCAKFTQRFGLDAHRFVNSELGKALNLRGVNARVVVPGIVRKGDWIAVERPTT
ncbi:MAG: hypothetical protein P8M16_10480 [Acidimicrobiales bacterium]|nr:hypothetical protein [Acidimicrobiales bacterium]